MTLSSDGSFSFLVGEGVTRVGCFAAGYSSAEFELPEQPTGLRWELSAIGGGVVSVCDELGNPVADAEIRVLGLLGSGSAPLSPDWSVPLGRTGVDGVLETALVQGSVLFAALDGRASRPGVMNSGRIYLTLDQLPVGGIGVVSPEGGTEDSYPVRFQLEGYPQVQECSLILTENEEHRGPMPRGAYTVTSADFAWRFVEMPGEFGAGSLRSAGLSGASSYATQFEVVPGGMTIWLKAIRAGGPFVLATDGQGDALDRFAVWEEFCIPSPEGPGKAGTWLPISLGGGIKSFGGPISLSYMDRVFLRDPDRRVVVGAAGFAPSAVDAEVLLMEEGILRVALSPIEPRYWIRIVDEAGRNYASHVVVRDPRTKAEVARAVPALTGGLIGPLGLTEPVGVVEVLAPGAGIVDRPLEIAPAAAAEDAPVLVVPTPGIIRVVGGEEAVAGLLRAIGTNGLVAEGIWMDSAIEFDALPPGDYALVGVAQVASAHQRLADSLLFGQRMDRSEYPIRVAPGSTTEVRLPVELQPRVVQGSIALPTDCDAELFVLLLSGSDEVPSRTRSFDRLAPVGREGSYSLEVPGPDGNRLAVVRVVRGWYIPLGEAQAGERSPLSIGKLAIRTRGLLDGCIMLTVRGVGASHFCFMCADGSETIDLGWLPTGSHDLRIQDPAGRETTFQVELGPGGQALDVDATPAARAAWLKRDPTSGPGEMTR